MSRKFYAVAQGRAPGIYTTWSSASEQVTGYSGAVYKSFKKRSDAEKFLLDNSQSEYKTNNSPSQRKHEVNNPPSQIILPRKGRLDESEDNYNFSIYTDGSSGQYSAGYGFVVVQNNQSIHEVSRSLPDNHTNNMAELSAIKEALYYVINRVEEYRSDGYNGMINVLILSDSLYSIRCLNEWYYKWQKNEWKTSQGKDVANSDLIIEVKDKLSEVNNTDCVHVDIRHVYGHSGDYWNEVADRLAYNAMNNSYQ